MVDRRTIHHHFQSHISKDGQRCRQTDVNLSEHFV